MATKKSDESKIWALIAYLLGIVGFILVLVLRKKDKFAMYHAKQALVLFIAYTILYVVGIMIPIIGWFIILPLTGLLGLIWIIIGIINALTGKQKPLPLIGGFAEKIKI